MQHDRYFSHLPARNRVIGRPAQSSHGIDRRFHQHAGQRNRLGAISNCTNYQIGWMAIGISFLVGIALRFFGRGKTLIFGISSVALALIGGLLGNLMFYAGIIREKGTSFLEVFLFLLVTPAAAIEVFTIAFDFMDILFYALATHAGFSASMDIKRERQ